MKKEKYKEREKKRKDRGSIKWEFSFASAIIGFPKYLIFVAFETTSLSKLSYDVTTYRNIFSGLLEQPCLQRRDSNPGRRDEKQLPFRINFDNNSLRHLWMLAILEYFRAVQTQTISLKNCTVSSLGLFFWGAL